MIVMFIAGWIAGVIGMLMFAHWWMHRNATIIRMTKEDMEEFDKQMEEKTDD